MRITPSGPGLHGFRGIATCEGQTEGRRRDAAGSSVAIWGLQLVGRQMHGLSHEFGKGIGNGH